MDLEFPKEYIDQDAEKVVRRLTRHNFTAYLVGGSVRDLLIGRLPKDFDLATDARPNQIKRLFRNSRIIGRRFKLAHIFFGEEKILETSTFRATPSERGEEEDLLILSDNLFGTPEEDALRRDFTINGLFYDVVQEKIIDYVGGIADIASRSIRTIGDPNVRFQEDPVRILRALRFAGKLGFTIEEKTLHYLKLHTDKLKLSSRRRVVDEIFKTLMGGAMEATLPLMVETGVLRALIPELAQVEEDLEALELLTKTAAFVDLFHQHVLMGHALTAPLIFQFWLKEVLVESRVKGNVVSRVFKEELTPLLITYGFSRFQRDQIHKILHIVAQLGHPSKRGKVSQKLQKKEMFYVAYLVWQILWYVRGVLPSFDLEPFLRPPQEIAPRTRREVEAQKQQGRGAKRLSEGSGSRRRRRASSRRRGRAPQERHNGDTPEGSKRGGKKGATADGSAPHKGANNAT